MPEGFVVSQPVRPNSLQMPSQNPSFEHQAQQDIVTLGDSVWAASWSSSVISLSDLQQTPISLSTGKNLLRYKFELAFYSGVYSWINPHHLGLAVHSSPMFSSLPCSKLSYFFWTDSGLSSFQILTHAATSSCHDQTMPPSVHVFLLCLVNSYPTFKTQLRPHCTTHLSCGYISTIAVVMLEFILIFFCLSPSLTYVSPGTISNLCLLSTQLRAWHIGAQ